MTGWRTDALGYPTARAPEPDSMPRRSRYTPPAGESVRVLRLVELLGDHRFISDKQQARLAEEQLPLGDPTGPHLWVAGDPALLHGPAIAVVGSRNVSDAGAARARRLGRELAEAGIVVVSGLAKGVDTHALRAAIAAGGRVAAVIGTPIDKAYPIENADLQQQIYRDHVLVSPFAPGSRVFRNNFPARNRIMAAVTDGTVIVEASNKSGALHQAAECARLQRWLFICRTLVETPGVTWPAGFLKDEYRARILTETRQIVEALALSR